MLIWITANLPTIIIGAIILAVVLLALRSVIKKRKQGGCSSCSGCSMSEICHENKTEQK